MAKAIGEGTGRQEGSCREGKLRREEAVGACPALRKNETEQGHRQHLAPWCWEAVGGKSGVTELNSRSVGVTRVVAPAGLAQEVLTKHQCWVLCHIPQFVLGRELTDMLRTDPNIFSKLTATPWSLGGFKNQANPLVLLLFPTQLSLSL